MVLIKGKKMADLQGFDGGRSPNEPERSEGNLPSVSNSVFVRSRKTQEKEKILTGKLHLPKSGFAFYKNYSRTLPQKKQKKWQTYKDSNLDKVNQNHLCYRYTTGLRLVNLRKLFPFRCSIIYTLFLNFSSRF